MEKFGSDLANMSFDFLNNDPVPCILCNEIFTINHDIQILLKHLLEVHKFVIGSPEEIADFRHYILYWKKLQFSNLEDYCIIYITNTEQNAKQPQEKFYFLCDKLPEDNHFRKTLQQMKLNFIIHQKEEEYKNKDFSRQCIYCPAVIEGGVANSFHHLTFDHGFSIGNPDNIVFGAKLLNIMDSVLKRLQCLYCEKTFKNHVSLRGHMRKKQHRSVNPQNKQYDQFYLRNYLKPGVSWKEAKKSILEEKENPILPGLMKRSVDEEFFEEEELWTDWREDAGGIPAICLFCPFTTTKISTLFHHMEDDHCFHFETITKDLNFYAKVKIINFIRTKTGNRQCLHCDANFDSDEALSEHIRVCNSSFHATHLWDSPEYLIPFLENDGLLIHLDDNDIDDEDTSSVASSINEEVVLAEDPMPVASILDDWQLRQELTIDCEAERGGTKPELSGALFKCFFCPFTLSGFCGKSVCISHMNSMHNFDYKGTFEAIKAEKRNKLINYIRAQTELGKCFVCRKSYSTKGALEEHRILEEHNTLSFNLEGEEQWEDQPRLPGDGFLLAD